MHVCHQKIQVPGHLLHCLVQRVGESLLFLRRAALLVGVAPVKLLLVLEVHEKILPLKPLRICFRRLLCIEQKRVLLKDAQLPREGMEDL